MLHKTSVMPGCLNLCLILCLSPAVVPTISELFNYCICDIAFLFAPCVVLQGVIQKVLLKASESFACMGSGGFRNLERGIQLLVREACLKIFWLPRPVPVMLEV